MSDEKRRGGEEEGGEGGPGLAYKVFVDMEENLDKLKLLHYEESFCKTLGFKPFSRYAHICFYFTPTVNWFAYVVNVAWVHFFTIFFLHNLLFYLYEITVIS